MTFMRRTLVALSLVSLLVPVQVFAGALCVKTTGTGGALKHRTSGVCPTGWLKLGSLDTATMTLQLSGVNLQIVSGSGATDGSTNGTGNLIIGYNEDTGAHDRTGSHNLIVGPEHTYSSYGGLVAGSDNTVSGTHASVSGGSGNAAAGTFASVSGGLNNTAGGCPGSFCDGASISGGQNNTAGTCGGSYCAAAAVSGGQNNTAGTCGGSYCTAASVNGGQNNAAGNCGGSYCEYATVSGGQNNASGSCLGANCSGAAIGGGAGLSVQVADEWHAAKAAGFPTATEY